MVYVIHYRHKHGDDISVYGLREHAEAACISLMHDRAKEAWHQDDQLTLIGRDTFDEKLSHFQEIEGNISYGETIEIIECEIL